MKHGIFNFMTGTNDECYELHLPPKAPVRLFQQVSGAFPAGI
jgi:hypothetical protein